MVGFRLERRKRDDLAAEQGVSESFVLLSWSSMAAGFVRVLSQGWRARLWAGGRPDIVLL
jgi:hypothetical protein